jgi:ABC-type multidrug transport system fused ATPase/permease subunit
MRSPEPGELPKVFTGARRGWVVGLVGLGLGQAALGAVSAWALTQLRGGGPWPMAVVIVSIVAAAVALGGLRVEERIAAERLGQDYVRDVRRDLVAAELTPGSRTHLGITVARTTNDLSSVRNWVSQGVGPLAAGIPLIVGSAVGLAIIDPFLGLGFLFPLGLLAAVLVPWARTAYEKSRRLRRARGRMATRIADTVGAAQGIIAARGAGRELGHIDSASDTVVDRAVDRSAIVGLIRAGGTVAAMLATLAWPPWRSRASRRRRSSTSAGSSSTGRPTWPPALCWARRSPTPHAGVPSTTRRATPRRRLPCPTAWTVRAWCTSRSPGSRRTAHLCVRCPAPGSA